MPENCAALIDALTNCRKSKGITQEQLAEATGIPRPAIARFETKKHMPMLSTLIKVAEALDCDLTITPRKTAL